MPDEAPRSARDEGFSPRQTLQSLFGPWPSVIVEGMRLPAEPPPLDPAEAEQVARAAAVRRIEYAAGRWCARRALAQLGVERFPLLNGPDRAPRWPAHVVGTISHSGRAPAGLCGVAVALARDVHTVGLDIESAAPLDPALWSYVLTAPERARCARHAPAQAGKLAKLMFSAKECFFKAQYPLSGSALDFQQADIDVDTSAGVFTVQGSAATPPLGPRGGWRGRYLFEDGHVFTGISVQRAPASGHRLGLGESP